MFGVGLQTGRKSTLKEKVYTLYMACVFEIEHLNTEHETLIIR